MRLGESTTYVVLSVNPPYNQLKIGDVAGLQLCEPGGPDFRVSVRLTHVTSNGDFEGTTLALQGRLAQRVGGSFINPAPGLNTL